jgi:23S rRNA pseudouridine1911/1915/1917 synthase
MSGLRLISEWEDGGKRLDAYLSGVLEGYSRTYVQKLIERGAVLVDGRPRKAGFRLDGEEEITVDLPEQETLVVEPEDIPLDVVFEDEYLMVVNKPKGMVVHPAPGHLTGTLVNAVLYHAAGSLSGINGVLRPGVVHRIDKMTSGLLIVAKNDAAHAGLAAQIEAHTFSRRYEGVVFGRLSGEGTVDRPVGRSRTDRKKMAVVPEGRRAVTHYEAVAEYPLANTVWTHARFTLETGRTHQIRVHMASLGHPVAGDDVYGSPKRDGALFPWLSGQCLHAAHIGFLHPVTGERLAFDAPLPEYFERTLAALRRGNG